MTPKKAASRSGAVAPRALVPMAHVADVSRSVEFYARFGFTMGGSVKGSDGTLVWAVVEHGGAQVMFARASAPVVAEQQAVLFYVYYDDVPATRDALMNAGVDTSEITTPPHSPRGEFRVDDPDGYAILVTHT